MSKRTIPLSSQVSRCRALAVGGLSSHAVLSALKKSQLQQAERGRFRQIPSLKAWGISLCNVIEEIIPLGAPIGTLLREVHPMIRQEEKLWMKVQALEKQFGFQGAIALVLPWAVAMLSMGVHLNIFTLLGAGLQGIGFFFFYWIIRGSTRIAPKEDAWMFPFLVRMWMRALAGMDLWRALEKALSSTEDGIHKLNKRERRRTQVFIRSWKSWLELEKTNPDESSHFPWPPQMPCSPEIAELIHSLLRTGAPCSEVLEDRIKQLDDERQMELEEKIQALPTKLSLAFCAFFTPALFLILLGALWPSLKTMPL